MATHITSENFEKEVTQSTIPVVIDFWASWCGPCQMMGPVFEELSVEYAKNKKAKLVKLSTEDEPELASQFNIRGIPTLGIFTKGKMIDSIVGFAPKETLKIKIDQALNNIR